MFVNPFKTPSDYAEALGKIGSFALITNIALLVVFSSTVFNISDSVLQFLNASQYADTVSVGGIKVPVVEFGFAVVIAVIARAIPLHVLLGKLFGILDAYMVKNILLPISSQSKMGVKEEMK